ncbi:MAG: alpha/beta hydrolase [Paracoccaceae bacterium]
MRFGVLILAVAVLAGCVDRSFTPVTPEALEVGTPVTLFGATSREPDEHNSFGPNRSSDLSLMKMVVSIPPSHTPGTLDFGYAQPDPATQFTLASDQRFSNDAAFRSALRASMPGSSAEAMIFVHGYNSTHAEAAFRAAQLTHDIGVPGAALFYSWPSQGNPLGYAYDGDSAIFARDGLEHLIRQVHASGVHRIVLVAHSMGSMVLMETLRQMEIQSPGWVRANIEGVVLISPDVDIEVFRSQMDRIPQPPEPFLVFVSAKDTILNLSRRLRGTHNSERLGNIENIEKVADLPITIVDTTAFADDAASGHFVAATSPTLLALLNAASDMASPLNRDPSSLAAALPNNAVIQTDRGATEVLLAPSPAEDR